MEYVLPELFSACWLSVSPNSMSTWCLLLRLSQNNSKTVTVIIAFQKPNEHQRYRKY